MEQKPPEPKLDDIGTRYNHLKDYQESLEACVEILKTRGGLNSKEKIAMLTVAADVLRGSLDAFSGYNETNAEYSLYRLLNTVPKDKEGLLALGGKPLEESNG